MRAAFGKVNTLHNHVLPWTDRPLVTQNLVGGEDGIDDAGISVARLIPNPLAVPRSDRPGVPRRLGRRCSQSTQRERPELRRPPARLPRHHRVDQHRPRVLVRVRPQRRRPGDGRPSSDFTTQLFGVDATLRWRPLQRVDLPLVRRPHASVIWSRREQPDRPAARRAASTCRATTSSRAAGSPARATTARTAPTDASLVDNGGSLLLTFWPSEFSQVRGQYRRTNYADGRAGQRAAVPVPVLDRRARRAPVLRVLGVRRSRRLKVARIVKVLVLVLRGRSMKRTRAAVRVALLAPVAARAQGKLNVVTTTEDLASIAREVGGDEITVEALARGYQDPHFVEAKPSFILKLQKADLLIVVGRELEIGWLPPLIQQSRNAKIQPGAPGYLDASLQARDPRHPRPARSRARWATCTRSATRTTGWIRRTASASRKAIADKLSELRPNDAPYFAAAARRLHERLDEAEKRWLAQMAPYKGTKVVTYHRSLPNFAERFGLDVDRLRRAEAGHPAVAAAHARSDQRDEAAERQDRAGRAVLRSRRRRTRSAARPARRCS